MKRGDVVFLALTEARCTPSGYCSRKAGCARFLVKPEQGRPVADFTVQVTIYAVGWCAGFMDADKHRDPLPGASGPRVHEAPQGIGRG
jgi:hypothetical protein